MLGSWSCCCSREISEREEIGELLPSAFRRDFELLLPSPFHTTRERTDCWSVLDTKKREITKFLKKQGSESQTHPSFSLRSSHLQLPLSLPPPFSPSFLLPGGMTSTPLTTPSRPTPSTSRPHAPLTASSPAYVTKDHKRHSLYGTEDRVVLDPGSSVWKVGFSGEPKPRAVFWAGEGERPIWEEEFEGVVREELEGLDLEGEGGGGGEGNWRREMGEEIVQRMIGDRLREVFAK